MDYYLQYPIRCKTCNEQIACFSAEHLDNLAQQLSVEESLNSLGLDNFCCRISMMNPITVTFDMENRPAIEGLHMVSYNDEPGGVIPYQGQYNFTTCRRAVVRIEGMDLFPVQTVPPPKPPPVREELSDLIYSAQETSEELIPFPTESKSEEQPFDPPTLVGHPKINPNSLYPDQKISVGAEGRTAQVISGRTYLAR